MDFKQFLNFLLFAIELLAIMDLLKVLLNFLIF